MNQFSKVGKICFFNTAKAWGGGEKWHYEVSSHLYSRGYDVFVVAHREGVLYQKLMDGGIPCKAIKLSNLSFLNPYKHFNIYRIFKREDIQTLVMNLSRDVKIAGPNAKKIGAKRIIYRRGSAIPIRDTTLNRYLFRHVVTEILANSLATKNTILENNSGLFPEERITVIHNGIEIESVQNQIGFERNSDGNLFTLLTLGRLEEQKNQKFLIPLAKELNRRGLSFRILIGGTGRLQGAITDLILKWELSEQIVLSGFIDNPLSFIQQADVFVLPSLWEGFGYVLAEAQLCQKPVIAFDLSSNPELVVEGKTGYLIPANDVLAFADKVCLLYENPEKRKTMGNAAFEYVKTHFDKSDQIQKIEDYLINEKAGRQ